MNGTYLFDKETLLTAKVAVRLKESLGTRANVLSKLIDVFRASEKGLRIKNPEYVVFTCRFSAEEEPIKLGVPFRSLGEQIDVGDHRCSRSLRGAFLARIRRAPRLPSRPDEAKMDDFEAIVA